MGEEEEEREKEEWEKEEDKTTEEEEEEEENETERRERNRRCEWTEGVKRGECAVNIFIEHKALIVSQQLPGCSLGVVVPHLSSVRTPT